MTSGAQPVRQRLVDTAVGRILREGMTVGLDHLSLEAVIAEAGVSRATAYRHWPNKAEFLREVLVTTVRRTRLEAESDDEIADLDALLAARADSLTSPQGRRNLVVEALRRAADADLRRVASSPTWQTYLALAATCRGLPASGLRDDVAAALAATDARFARQRAEVYRNLARLIGYRLVSPLAEPWGYDTMATAAGAVMTGLAVTAAAQPELATATRDLAPFDSTEPAPWTTPALLLAGTILSHIEPDPDLTWDGARIELSLTTLAEMRAMVDRLRAEHPD